MPEVLVPAVRFERWVANFEGRHGASTLHLDDGGLAGDAQDGSRFAANLPYDAAYSGPPEAAAFAEAAAPPGDWGVLLVRKGGFAIARLHGDEMTGSKIGRRHVQGRTKAGGRSQQRFARRRDNQARHAFEAAADHAARLLAAADELVTVAGGDRTAVAEVLADRRLAHVRVVGPWLPVRDPRRAELEAAIGAGRSIRIRIQNQRG